MEPICQKIFGLILCRNSKMKLKIGIIVSQQFTGSLCLRSKKILGATEWKGVFFCLQTITLLNFFLQCFEVLHCTTCQWQLNFPQTYNTEQIFFWGGAGIKIKRFLERLYVALLLSVGQALQCVHKLHKWVEMIIYRTADV